VGEDCHSSHLIKLGSSPLLSLAMDQFPAYYDAEIQTASILLWHASNDAAVSFFIWQLMFCIDWLKKGSKNHYKEKKKSSVKHFKSTHVVRM